ncbi:5'/3'-nucleotidase SurE [Acholeplasma hippikon]|uniref:5'-nucleotidase SurE n=1 Tax=Acholeplasma hippikon TaxID=264636 RepID=A0A449BJ02_9MOLU|nr:5'/3'-nucleotidase SurE [Acholeplasma hippikon]VEU82383.1 5'-nucleotidase surE [Acholeplasma hippikon]
MNILVVNDDGIEAEGIKILVKAASHFGSVFVAAPKYQQSAMSAAISYKGTMEIEEVEPLFASARSIAVTGTPADCIKAGLKLFDQEFDLVLSGINHGVNLAKDIQYSGTVAAAMEASIYGIPAIAFSAPDIKVPYLYDETVKLLDELIETELYKNTGILNVNFPHTSFKKVQGIRVTKLGQRLQYSELMKTDKPNVYRLHASDVHFKEDEDSDMTAYYEGYVSITPMQFDRTDYKKLKNIFSEENK